MLNSLNFCLSEKLLILPSNLNERFAGYSILGCRFPPFITLNISWPSLLACRISENSAYSLWEFFCMLFATFNILSLIFVKPKCVLVCSSRFILYGTTLHFLGLCDIFLSEVREVFSYYIFKYSLWPFLSYPPVTLIVWGFVCLMLSQMTV